MKRYKDILREIKRLEKTAEVRRQREIAGVVAGIKRKMAPNTGRHAGRLGAVSGKGRRAR